MAIPEQWKPSFDLLILGKTEHDLHSDKFDYNYLDHSLTILYQQRISQLRKQNRNSKSDIYLRVLGVAVRF